MGTKRILHDIPLSANTTKWSNTLKQYVATADEMLECVCPFFEVGIF